MNPLRTLFAATLAVWLLCGTLSPGWSDTPTAPPRPNIVLIMADDLGFADLGFQGGEIRSPNLDRLAAGGIRFSHFYNNGRCCPTRAALMTGLQPHQVGIGHMTSPGNSRAHDRGVPGYRGFLNDSCVTMAEVLKSAGYATLMAGKWHLGYDQRECWPLQRGFDRYYGCVDGATRYFHPVQPRGMVLDNEPVDPVSTTDGPFYTTDAFTDHAIRFVREHVEGPRQADPFFLYLAYTAPHWPLQAPEEDIARYRGKYKLGWDQLRQQRYQRQIELGLIDPAWPLSPRPENVPAWDSLDPAKQDEMDLKMAIYAAMVDRVDQRIGSLIQTLQAMQVFDNTLIVFLSDNGACQEGGVLGRGEFIDIEKRNLQFDNSYGEAWANAGSTPFRLYKHFVHEGGSASPFLMHWPARIKPRNDWYGDHAQLIDLMPTFAELAGAVYPQQSRGNDLPPLEGISLQPALDGLPLVREQPIFMEHENNATVRQGPWKLVGRNVATPAGVEFSRWELYDLETDRTELHDLAAQHPERTRQMADQWNAWASRTGVYPKGSPVEGASPESPTIARKPLRVTATVRADRPQGTAISQGGLRFGYSLHFVDGRPAFSIRNRGQLTELVADNAVTGTATVQVDWTAQTLTLSVDSVVVAETASPGLLAEQPALGLYRSMDYRDPVGSYRSPNRLQGELVTASVAPLPESVPTEGTTSPVASPAAAPTSARPGSPPHIVVFLSDDHTWRDSSVYGSSDIQTPNMDRLAAAGMTLDRAFVASPSCAPSRAALLTGLWPARNGAEANHSRPHASIKKLPAYLKEQGYEVVSFGKVGHYRQTPEYEFDLAKHFGYHEDVAVEQAVQWLRTRDNDQPLCLFVGTNWPHVPWPADDVHPEIVAADQVVPPNHVDSDVTRDRRARYVAAIRIMDDELGQVYDTARQVLGDHTFFLHTSDHGAQWPFSKWTLYDDGVRTPMIASWPGHIPAGGRSDAIVSWIDVLPTLVDVAGGPAPAGIDGRSFLPVLTGQTQQHRQQAFFTHSGDGNNNVYPMRGVSTADGWKYIRNLHPEFRFTTHITTKPGDTGYWPDWVRVSQSDPAAAWLVQRYQVRPVEELYRIETDRYEMDNLVNDPQHQNRLLAMRQWLDQWMAETDDRQTVFGEPVPVDAP